MVTDVLTSSIAPRGVPLIGGGVIGFGVGYFLKKIIKFILLGLGAIAFLLGFLRRMK